MDINDKTWNPWHGCHKCSEGCQNCYASVISAKGVDLDLKTTIKATGKSNLHAFAKLYGTLKKLPDRKSGSFAM